MQIQPDTVRQIIELARDWDKQFQLGSSDHVVRLAEIAAEPPRYHPAQLKLLEAIGGLTIEEKAELQALYWLGREREESSEKDSGSDSDLEDLAAYWESLLNLSKQDCEDAADYLLGKKASLLINYLSEGYEAIARLDQERSSDQNASQE